MTRLQQRRLVRRCEYEESYKIKFSVDGFFFILLHMRFNKIFLRKCFLDGNTLFCSYLKVKQTQTRKIFQNRFFTKISARYVIERLESLKFCQKIKIQISEPVELEI